MIHPDKSVSENQNIVSTVKVFTIYVGNDEEGRARGFEAGHRGGENVI